MVQLRAEDTKTSHKNMRRIRNKLLVGIAQSLAFCDIVFLELLKLNPIQQQIHLHEDTAYCLH